MRITPVIRGEARRLSLIYAFGTPKPATLGADNTKDQEDAILHFRARGPGCLQLLGDSPTVA